MLLVIVPTIVTVEELPQASEGKSDSSPSNSQSFSPLPEETSLDPSRDFPLAYLSGESGRTLYVSISEKLHISNPNDYIDTVKDWDLRNPIAPPLTSLEGAMVLSSACTTTFQTAGKELIVSKVRQT